MNKGLRAHCYVVSWSELKPRLYEADTLACPVPPAWKYFQKNPNQEEN